MRNQFYYCDNEHLRNGFKHLGVYFSEAFCDFFSTKLEQVFFAATGLRPSSKITLAGFKQENDRPFYEVGRVSRLNVVLWIMPDLKSNISFCWQSKSGKIVATTDEKVDVSDLEYWIEGLQPAVYWQKVATEKRHHPFHFAKLPFQLKVIDFGENTRLIFELEDPSVWQVIKSTVSKTVEEYENVALNDYENYGVPHSVKFREVGNGQKEVQIDTGSAGFRVIKTILEALKSISGIRRITIDI